MQILEYVAMLAVPAVVVCAGLIMLFGGNDRFDKFLEGAREGLVTGVKLLPTLVALLAAISMLRASGAVELASSLLRSPAEKLGMPVELLPLVLTRPFSGSASSALFASLLDEVGADSFAAMCAAVIMGSSDTVFYVISVYFSSVKIRKTGYAIPVALTVMTFCLFFSCFICRLWFGG